MSRPTDADLRKAAESLRRDTRIMGGASRSTVETVLSLIDPQRYSRHPAHAGWILEDEAKYLHIDEAYPLNIDIIGHVIDALNAFDKAGS